MMIPIWFSRVSGSRPEPRRLPFGALAPVVGLLPVLFLMVAPSVVVAGEAASELEVGVHTDERASEMAPPPRRPSGRRHVRQESVIALVQYDGNAYFGDYAYNIFNLTELSLEAVEGGAEIVVHPELSAHGYATSQELWCTPGRSYYYGRSCRDVSEIAEPIPGGQTTEYWAHMASEYGVYIVYGLPEVEGDRFYNAVGVVGPKGYVTKYRKRMLYYYDLGYASRGTEAVVLQTEMGDFGLMICADASQDGHFYDEYKSLGVDRIILSMDWDQDPYGPYAASTAFVKRAENNGVAIYAADVPIWDGTGLYLPGEATRRRNGLPDPAVGINGVSTHVIEY